MTAVGSGNSAEDGLTISVHVRPGGHRDAVECTHDGVLAVRVSAAPEHGKANAAVCAVVADAFGVHRRDVTVISGTTNRRKRLHIHGAAAVLSQRLQQLLDQP